ncbi:hypothetical protein ACUOFC_66465, partial [Escherichia sp. TWPC-MK]
EGHFVEDLVTCRSKGESIVFQERDQGRTDGYHLLGGYVHVVNLVAAEQAGFAFGAEVTGGDILVGKVTPKGETQLT